MRAQIVLFDGFDPLDVIAPYEVLAAGGMVTDGGVRAELVSAEGEREVPSGLGTLTLRATTSLRPADADVVVAGLITGRPTTTHHMGLELLGTTGAQAIDARVVDDGDLITGATVTSGLDVGLYLLERELGSRVAVAVERLIAHERRGTVWRATGIAPV